MKPYQREEVPDIVVSRLPVYLRELTLMAEEGMDITSSKELAQRLGISSAEIRKDLSHFGEFGKQGTGYRIAFLSEKLQEILGLTRQWDVALVGAGDLGHALVHYNGFIGSGFRISLVFDSNPSKVGTDIGGLTILSDNTVGEEIRKNKLRMAIIAVPAAAAQKVADMLVEAGIAAILTYAPITLQVPPGVHVQYVDPVAQLRHMTYYLV